MAGNIQFAIAVLALLVGACGDNSKQADDAELDSYPEVSLPLAPVSEEPSSVISQTAPTLPQQPDHNYDEKRGWNYYYIAAVSEEDQKRGRATGTVSTFQYLGQNNSGEHILAGMNPDGTVNYRAKCLTSCRIIDTDDGAKIAYSTRSVIGGAFEDAFGGKLDTRKNPSL